MDDMPSQDFSVHLLQMERYLWTILSMDMTAVLDLEGSFMDLNPAWGKTVGYGVDKIKGSYLIEYLKIEEREQVLGKLQKLVTSDFETTSIDFRFLGNEGEYHHLLANVAFVPEHECYYIVARSLVGEGSEAMAWAYHDVLTGLPNRYLLQQRLTEMLESLTGHDDALAVMFLDLDRFKPVNDTHGHKTGDILLQEVAGRLKSLVTDAKGFPARLGGDEFVIVAEGQGVSRWVSGLADEIIQGLEKPFTVLGETIHISGSIGISLYPRNGRDTDSLLQSADEAMYRAKRSGRGHFLIAEG